MGLTNACTGYLPTEDPELIYDFRKDGIKSIKGGFLKFKTQPYNHQLACLKHYGSMAVFALLAEMGTGKTWIAINNYAFLLARGKVANMLVIAPNGVQWNWTRNEIPMHLPEQLQRKVQYAAYSGAMKAKERRTLSTFLDNAGTKPSILCVSWDSLSHKSGRDVIDRFLDSRSFAYNMVVLDESDYAKNPSTARAKFLNSIKQRSSYRRIMTGTVITNSPFDAWSQFNFLSDTVLQCKSFYAFKLRHGIFYPKDSPIVRHLQGNRRGVPLIQQKDSDGRPAYKNLDMLKRLIKPYSFMVKKSDCLDLPQKIYKTVYVEMSKEQQRVYALAKKEGILLLSNYPSSMPVPMESAITIAIQLSQITGNHVEATKVVDPTCNPKLEKAAELIERALSHGSSVIVWARFVAEIEDLANMCKQRGFPFATYYGATSFTDRQQAIDDFQQGKTKVFISNPQSGGTGLTLTAANVVIYYSNSYRLHDRLQSEDRCHRIGQTKSVFYIDLVAENTIDEDVLHALRSKLDVAQAVTNWKQVLR